MFELRPCNCYITSSDNHWLRLLSITPTILNKVCDKKFGTRKMIKFLHNRFRLCFGGGRLVGDDSLGFWIFHFGSFWKTKIKTGFLLSSRNDTRKTFWNSKKLKFSNFFQCHSERWQWRAEQGKGLQSTFVFSRFSRIKLNSQKEQKQPKFMNFVSHKIAQSLI